MDRIERDLVRQAAGFALERMNRLHASHGWDHVQRVVNNSLLILKTEPGANPFIVETAAILHDIARSEETTSRGKVCHADEGSSVARRFLLESGFDEARTEHICECIRTHRFRKDNAPVSIEARIVYDADKLDSIGAVGIGRAFLFAGEVGACLHNPGTDINTTLPYSSEDTAYREYMVKLRHVPGKMLTSEGRRLAEGRYRFMEEYFKRLTAETSGLL